MLRGLECEERSAGIEDGALCFQPTDLIQRILQRCFKLGFFISSIIGVKGWLAVLNGASAI